MKLTQEIIDQIQEAMLHTKKDGTVNWKDTDEIEVQLAGTFAADRFIVIKDSKKGPNLSWVKVGVSDLYNVEIIEGLSKGDIVYILPSKSLFDYQSRFKERVNATFSIG